ncbi:helix-turn-helix domain-containing protein [Kribbella karoonensis]|uniref:Winged helix-turn-helix transcriptional regulator n=1 Tax=Kribbella karoonensis TaxID=324851 RepID=A0ABN2ELK2_9ACTN
MSTKRTYGDGCGIARALDFIGERWALLVVRELLLGPKRFTDLRAGLPGASPNVLATRLRELEEAHVVRHRKAGPPVGSQVYELTEWGAALEPVLMQLGLWATGAPETNRDPYRSPDSLALWMRAAFSPAAEPGLATVIVLGIDDDEFVVRVNEGRLSVERGGADRFDARIAADLPTMTAVLKRRRSVSAAVADKSLTCSGDSGAVERLIRSLSTWHSAEPVTT